ncbi:MAG: SpoIIE family protein phosphatase [Treponema sp.]|nr:SpoIIE family protein phosphatase [Treponema sp.]
MPLLAIAAVSILLLFLCALIRKRKSARVSFITYISLIIIAITSISTFYKLYMGQDYAKASNFFMLAVFAALFLQIPIAIMFSTFEPVKFDSLIPRWKNKHTLAALQNEAAKAAAEERQVELSEQDLRLLDVSRDFTVHAVDSYTSDKGITTFLEYINKTIKDQISADGGAILMIDDFEDIISVKTFDGDFPPPYKLPADLPHKPIRVATNFKFATFPLEGNIFGEIATQGRAELITKPETDSRIYQNGPEEFLECGSYIISPMKIQDTVIGLAAFARKHGNEVFNEDELKITSTLCDFAAATIKNVIAVQDIIEQNEVAKEAELASRIQASLKPAKLPLIQGLQFGVFWDPCQGVCGDSYDILVSRKDRISFIMSDIAGKGMNSVVVMSMVRSMLRLVINSMQSAGKILSWVNRGISAESFSTDHFGSTALINYDPTTSSVEVASGGVIPVYLYDGEKNECRELTSPTAPIGVEKTSEYKDFVQKVKNGDIIFTYTDGLVEALNESGQQYSKESLLRVIQENHAKSGKDIARLVKEDVKKFTGSAVQHDDKTLLIVKIQ